MDGCGDSWVIEKSCGCKTVYTANYSYSGAPNKTERIYCEEHQDEMNSIDAKIRQLEEQKRKHFANSK